MSDERSLGDEPSVREAMLETFVERRGMGWWAWFGRWDVQIAVGAPRRSRGDVHALVRISSKDAPGYLHVGTLNLSSTTARGTLAKALAERTPERSVPWRELLERVCAVILAGDEGFAESVLDGSGSASPPAWRLDPLLPLGKPTILYGPGGSGKSYLALAMVVSVETGAEVIAGFRPLLGRTLYLDWESDGEDLSDRLRRICTGAGIDPPAIRYWRCSRPFADLAEQVAERVSQEAIGLIVLDSLGLAAGTSAEGSDAAETALRLFGALREVGTTAFLIDHVPVSELGQDGRNRRPYGSVYKANLARSTWELRNSEGHLALYHTKSNLGRPHAPIGLRMEDVDGAIGWVREEIVEELTPALSVADRIAWLIRQGPLTVKEMAERLGISESNVRAQLSRHSGRFIKVGEVGWGLLGRPLSEHAH